MRKQDFPLLADGRLAYLDSASTAQKPAAVLEAMRRFYEEGNANAHRGAYPLAEEATAAYESARGSVARFLGADPGEIAFTSGATAGINLVAQSWGQVAVRAGDEILVTEMEHHSNLLPWQLLAKRAEASIRVIPVVDGRLDLDAFRSLLNDRTRLVAVTHVSNVLGTVNPIQEICDLAHAAGAKVLVDGAQAVAHLPVDVRALGCDFYAFSGHKLYGPMGIGALWARKEILDAMPPAWGGGGMVERVEIERSTYQSAPHRLEAGTQNIAGAIGLAEAIRYVESVGLDTIQEHEEGLMAYAALRVSAIDGLHAFGPDERVSALSFAVDGIHPHDLATALGASDVAIRAGHHCCQPLMNALGVSSTCRASFGLYNETDDIDRLVDGIEEAKRRFL